jgi:pimeloyl-ACP methyl ester carboxylesterase
MTTYVLIHGAWHDGSTWAAVAKELRKRGHVVHTPTMAGHGEGADKNVTHAHCVDSIKRYLLSHDLDDIVLVGHSLAGTVIAQLAAQLPQRIRRLVFLNAFVPQDGNALLDEVPPHYAAFFTQLAGESTDNTVTLPFDMWCNGFINDADPALAQHIYDHCLSPEPFSLFTEKHDLTHFYQLTIPSTYLYCKDDLVFPDAQWNWVPRFPDRLRDCRRMDMSGSHEVLFTAPLLLANNLVEAGRD